MITDLTAKARKLAGILVVPAWRAALRRHRVAAGVEHARVPRTLGEVRTVVDIGANRGQFALAARHCFPDARIVSFEPLAGPAAFATTSKAVATRGCTACSRSQYMTSPRTRI